MARPHRNRPERDRPKRDRSDRGPGADPRRLAAALILRVLDERRMLDDMPVDAPPPVAARALRLARATLRHLSQADAVLSPLLRRPPPAPVMAILRLAVVEMLELGAPAHGVVDEAVAATRAQPKGAALSGLVNAVLRRVAETPGTDWAALPVPRLPDWLRARLIAAWGAPAVERIEAAHLRGGTLDLTPKRTDGPEDEALVAALVGAVERLDRLPGGSLRLTGAGQVSVLPGFEAGQWWVQDAAAALAAPLLNPRPGMRIVDLCAAPGGKTLQLAAAGAEVTAVDVSEHRLARLRENLARMGLAAEVVAADALDWTPPVPVDAVLLDAPCTATGTIRRHPDLPHVRREANLAALAVLQARLLDRALAMLRPGGTLVYCTCSLLPEEGEAQIAAALARHAGRLALDPLPAPPFGRAATGGGWRTRPDDLASQGGVDGFFIARLTRTN